ncbi:MAG: cellulase family glycosylhydrolase [Phycisphaerae bacterium]
MKKRILWKTMYINIFFVLLLCTSRSFGWIEWHYAGTSPNWNQTNNWTPTAVPTASQDPIMRGYGVNDYAVIGSGINAVGHMMWVGYSGRADLNITGGSLTLSNQFRFGQAGGIGNVNVSSGTISVGSDMVVGDGGTGVGTLNMTGGSLNHLLGWLYIGYNGAAGTINLDGGTLSTLKVVMGTGSPHLNITGGKLVITNTDAAGVANELNGYIQAGQLTFYNGDPRATHTFTVNGSGFTEVTASLPNAEYAWNPNPANLSAGVNLNSNLTWSAGIGAISHDVYFGTSFDDVNNASRQSLDFDGDGIISWSDLDRIAEQWLTSYNFIDFAQFAEQFYTEAVPEFAGNQTAMTFDPGTLSADTTYYWRIDEVTNSATYKGFVWGFTTGPIIAAPEKNSVNKYDALFVNIGSSATWSNPYNPDDIRVDAIITPPSGPDMVLPCFYTGGQSGNSQWQCRFTPRQVGTYSYRIDIYQSSVLTASSQNFSLNVSDSTGDGFVLKNTSSYYTFIHDSGKRIRGIGENIGWEQGGYMYDRLFPLLNSLGCNYVRLWVANPYNVQLEGVVYGLGRYDEQISQRLDNTVNLARQNGIYLTVSIDGAGELDPNPTDPLCGWPKNPYNTVNGGMCSTQTDFFTSTSAKAQYKKKLRYIIARWGYSTNVAALEFWNEIDGAWVHYGVNRDAVENWHNEIAAYLKNIDPFDHIVTTSCTGYQDSGFWDMPDIDFSQTHPYRTQQGSTIFDPVNFYNLITNTYENVYGKPHVLGEFGYTSGEPTIETHANMVDNLHRGLWFGMFSPTPILPLTWWWDYFERNNDESQFSVAAAFLNQMMSRNADIVSRSATIGNSNITVMAVKTMNDQFVFLRNNSSSTQSNNMTLTLTGMTSGSYTYKFYNTATGVWGSPTTKSTSGTTFTLIVPSMSGYLDEALWIAPNF